MNDEIEGPEKQLAKLVGAVIARKRKAKGLTQAQLAEKMSIEKETISRVETGVISPTLSRLAQLAQILDCEMTDLLRIRTPEVEDHALFLAGRMGDLSDTERELIVDMLSRVAGALNKFPPKERKIVERFLFDVIQPKQ